MNFTNKVQVNLSISKSKDILLQYMCSKTVPTENRIEIKTKEIHFSLFYLHLNYTVDHPDTTALVRDKQYGGNVVFLHYW